MAGSGFLSLGGDFDSQSDCFLEWALCLLVCRFDWLNVHICDLQVVLSHEDEVVYLSISTFSENSLADESSIGFVESVEIDVGHSLSDAGSHHVAQIPHEIFDLEHFFALFWVLHVDVEHPVVWQLYPQLAMVACFHQNNISGELRAEFETESFNPVGLFGATAWQIVDSEFLVGPQNNELWSEHYPGLGCFVVIDLADRVVGTLVSNSPVFLTRSLLLLVNQGFSLQVQVSLKQFLMSLQQIRLSN